MQTLIQDLRYGARMLLKQPGFTLIAVVTLALGIGATTAIFSVVDTLLLRPLPDPDAGRLVVLREVGNKGGQMNLAEPNFQDLLARQQSFSALAIAMGSFPLVVSGANEAARVRLSFVSNEFFAVVGVAPQPGRAFLPEEEKYGGPMAAAVSHGYWRQVLGGRTDFENVRLKIDGVSCHVVGVMPPGSTTRQTPKSG
ncbi:MAG: ABC transporter permease [Blastocatellia bacterium]